MKNKLLIISSAFLILFATSCTDLLETQPRQSLSSGVALTDFTGLAALQISVYSRAQQFGYYGQPMQLSPEVLADNYTTTNTGGGRYVNERNNAPGVGFNIWLANYAGINEANFIISAVDASNGTAVQRNNLKGEALFMRGLLYFDLMRVYAYFPNHVVGGFNQGVIMRTTPTDDVSKADFKARGTIAEGYAQIEADLTEAFNILPVTLPTGTVFRANKSAAAAILAKVYLFQEKWAQAEAAATNAINNKPASVVLRTPANYVASFAAVPHPESLFELDYLQNQFSTVDGVNNSLYSLTQPAPAGGFFALRATPELLASFEAGDVRANMFVTIVGGTNNGFVYSTKHNETKGNFFNNVPVIRLSEVYLIRAEARARQGAAKTADAQADVQLIRTNRGLPAPVVEVGAALIDLIFDERRRELNLEGHRFWDFKRRGLTIPKTAGFTPVPFNDFRILFPIPNAQVILNPMLTQNPGY